MWPSLFISPCSNHNLSSPSVTLKDSQRWNWVVKIEQILCEETYLPKTVARKQRAITIVGCIVKGWFSCLCTLLTKLLDYLCLLCNRLILIHPIQFIRNTVSTYCCLYRDWNGLHMLSTCFTAKRWLISLYLPQVPWLQGWAKSGPKVGTIFQASSGRSDKQQNSPNMGPIFSPSL